MKALSSAVVSVFLVMAAWLSVTGQTALPTETIARGPIKTILPAAPTRIPMDHRSGNPIVKVFVNNEGPFDFLIDTCAAGHARIDRSLVERFGLNVAGTVLAGDGTGRNSRETDVVHIDSLTLGGAHFENVEALAGDYGLEHSDSPTPIVGILCFGLFADCVLTIDYPAETVIVDQSALGAEGDHIVPFTAKRGIPSIEMTLGGRRFDADVDTGSRGGLMVPISSIDTLDLDSRPTAAGTAQTRFNTVEISKAPVDGDLSLAGHVIPHPVVYFADLFEEANLGYEVLRNYSLTFDQANSRLRFNRPPNLSPAPPPERTDLPWNPVYLAMDMSGGKPVIHVGVNGEGPFPFELDTATPHTLLDRRFAEKLGLRPADQNDAYLGHRSGAGRAPSVFVETLSMGIAAFSGVDARIVDLNESGASSPPPAGVLGFRLFADCLLTLDYPENRVIVERGQLLFPDGKEVLDLIVKDDSPFALLTLGPIALETCLDSGSTKSLVVPGSIDPIADRATIGCHTITDPDIVVNDGAPHAVAGSEFLRSFSLTFDQKNRRFRIAQPH